MLPQTNTPSTTRTLMEIPSKTYKLNIDTGNYVDFTNPSALPYFNIVGNDLVVTYNTNEPTFEIRDGNLIIIGEQDEINCYQVLGDSLYYQGNSFSDDRIMGYVDNLEAVKQMVYHTIMTERYAYLIYSNDYGIELDQYKGKPFDYLESTIEKTLQEALMYDMRIKNVSVTNIQKLQDSALISFTVYSIYGDLQMEVSIVV